ncbi:MAG: hypothetical protein WBG32_03605 [Nodosilinea sp.]
MKRKAKPLITGGLLGLAGLGLLPRSAEANTDVLPVVPDPSLGAALAADPHPVVSPAPSAQTTAPQTDDQGAAQPAWTPEVDQPVVAAAAAAATAELTSVAISQPELPTPELANLEFVAPEPAVPEPTAQEYAAPEISASEPAASEPAAPESLVSDRAEADLAAPAITAAVSTPVPDPDLTPVGVPGPSDSGLAERPPASSTPLPATRLPETAATTVSEVSDDEVAAIASPPAPATAGLPETAKTPADITAETFTETFTTASVERRPAIAAKPSASQSLIPAPAATAGTGETNGDDTAAIAIAPAPSPVAAPVRPTVPEAPVARPSSRQTAPDLATLRSRAATVQALLHDLRSAYGIEDSLAATDSTAAPAAATGPVSRPETLNREPQLPPLPSRSAHRRPVAQPQGLTAAARTAPVANAPQLPSLPGQTPNVALALPTPQPVMSSGRSASLLSSENVDPPSVEVAAALLPEAAMPPDVPIAQATPPTPGADQVRDDLRIEPLTTAADPAQTFPPSPNAGIPSAFGAEWGDVFFSASLAGADRLRAEADGSLSMGFGLGDARRAVGVELTYNLQSIRQFGENGGFDAKVHREVYSSDETQVAAAVGVNNFVSYGADTAGTSSSVYGVVTAAHLLQPEHPVNRLPITTTLGAGSGYFSGDNTDVGVIAGVGLQVHPQFSINTAWSGVGLNVGASIVPEPTIPLTLNLLYGDIGNNTRAGSVAVISIGYGFNFGPRF